MPNGLDYLPSTGELLQTIRNAMPVPRQRLSVVSVSRLETIESVPAPVVRNSASLAEFTVTAVKGMEPKSLERWLFRGLMAAVGFSLLHLFLN